MRLQLGRGKARRAAASASASDGQTGPNDNIRGGLGELRNTGWSLSRKGNLGLAFASVNFWDGAAFIVKSSLGAKSALELDGVTVCRLPGTSTELIVTDWFRAHKLKFSPVLIEGDSTIQGAVARPQGQPGRGAGAG